MADGSKLRLPLVGILNSEAVQKIDFIFGPHHITGAGFRHIAAAVLFGRIGIDIDPAGLAKRNAGAEYQSIKPEKLVFPSATVGKTLPERMNIVHECTHAIVDRNGAWWTLRVDNEGAAYVAGALYCFYDYPFSAAMLDVFEGRPDQGWITGTTQEPFATAMNIARSIRSKPGARVSTQDAMLLRSQIINHPAYKGMTLGTPDMASGLQWD